MGKGNRKSFLCPEKLKYNFTEAFKLKVSKKCCDELKKIPAAEWARENGKKICITGIRKSEGGSRAAGSCTVFYDKNCNELKKFHPLFVCPDKWIEDFIKIQKVHICDIYNEPYNFHRTGCKGCPYDLNLQKDLDTMAKFFPAERKQCEIIWEKVYSEYRRIGYRLKPADNQPELFDDN